MTIEEFEAARPRLLALAHRLLGSVYDAEDAVQTVWLRTQSVSPGSLDNPAGWLTTVTTRVCLDQLRAWARHGETPLLADTIPATQLTADEEFIRREDVARALMVLLGQLTPTQRVSYVLHDLFSIPFDEIAAILDTTSANAKTLASRARTRIRGTHRETEDSDDRHRRIVAAFLHAARGGDIQQMIALMAADCVRTADAELLPAKAAAKLTGASAIAEETRFFVNRIHATTTMRRNGRMVEIIAPGGHPLAGIHIDTGAARITRIAITKIRKSDILTAA